MIAKSKAIKKEDLSEIEYKKRSRISEVFKRMKRNKSAIIGLIIICIFASMAIFADVIADYETKVIQQDISIRLQAPSKEHIFGTDAYGRDIFARIVHGARVSLTIGLTTTSIALIIGGIFGSIAGYYGGIIDGIIMRIMDTIMCIPPILLSLAIVASLGPGIRNLLIAITVSSVPSFTRIIRSSVLLVVEQDFIEAARSYGTSDKRIIGRYIIPNAIGPIIVQATMSVGVMIINAAALSFLGMGIEAPNPEWGAMLSESREYMRNSPYLVIIPGLAILLTSLSLNLLGDGLRDALDPKLKD